MSRLRGIFDLESNELLYYCNKMWCIVIKDQDTGEVWKYPPNMLEEGLSMLSDFRLIIGHNICQFDIPLIEKLYPGWEYQGARDTLCISRLVDPERFTGHSLDSYGKQFKRYKPVHEDWSRYSPEMLHRCSEDVEINSLVYQMFVGKYLSDPKWDWLPALLLEQEFARGQALQEVEGVDIDVGLAEELVVRIDREVDELDLILKPRLPKRVVRVGQNHVKEVFKMDGSYQKKVIDWFADELSTQE